MDGKDGWARWMDGMDLLYVYGGGVDRMDREDGGDGQDGWMGTMDGQHGWMVCVAWL